MSEAAAPESLDDRLARLKREIAQNNAENIARLNQANADLAARLVAAEVKKAEGRKELFAAISSKVFGAVLIGLGIWKNDNALMEFGGTIAGVGGLGLILGRSLSKMGKAQ